MRGQIILVEHGTDCGVDDGSGYCDCCSPGVPWNHKVLSFRATVQTEGIRLENGNREEAYELDNLPVECGPMFPSN